MSVELWQSLTAEEKYTRERQWLATHGQAPGPKQKQGNYIASGEDLKALEGKSVVERLTYARERAAQQQTG
jgi:hypothetical protein